MGQRFRRKYATWADALEAEAREQGLSLSREEACVRAMRGVLKGVLLRLFEELPADAEALIDQASLDQLMHWCAESIDAKNVADLLSRK